MRYVGYLAVRESSYEEYSAYEGFMADAKFMVEPNLKYVRTY